MVVRHLLLDLQLLLLHLLLHHGTESRKYQNLRVVAGWLEGFVAVALAVVVVLKALVAVALAVVLAQGYAQVAEKLVEAQHVLAVAQQVLVVVEAQHVLVVVERIDDHNHRRIFSLQLT